MSAYIVTGDGFLVDVIFNRETRTYDFKYSPTIRGAKKYKQKYANALIANHKLNAFVWKPYEETPGDKLWVVVQEHLEWGDKRTMWTIMRRTSLSDNDARYLARKGEQLEGTGMSKDKATLLAIEKNAEEYDKLISHIEKLNEANEKLMNDEHQ